MSNKTKTICILAYEGVELLDLSGPQSALYEANQAQSDSYEVKIAGFTQSPLTCEAGLQIIPDFTLEQIKDCHSLIIPGGSGSRSEHISAKELDILRALIARCERVVSVCTGAYLLARCGLPDGTRLATHWAFAKRLAHDFPALDVESTKLFIREGKYWSSAGVTSGIDLTLSLIEQDYGSAVAHYVAKHLVVYMRRSGNQKQYSDLLDTQSPRHERLGAVMEWIRDNISKDISVCRLAEQLCLSERQCHRFFIKETGLNPATFVEKFRMQVASDLLVSAEREAKVIAQLVGFSSYDGFRKAFVRHFSITPTAYRNAFRFR